MVHLQYRANGAGCSVSLESGTSAPLLTVIFTRNADLNLPITGFAAVLVVVFMKLRTPTGTLREKLARMDWMYVPSTPPVMCEMS